jgi:hypothetical protein
MEQIKNYRTSQPKYSSPVEIGELSVIHRIGACFEGTCEDMIQVSAAKARLQG